MPNSVKLAHMPPELAVHVGLYSDVLNAAFLKEQLLAGNAEFEYAFIDASMILSNRHVLSAAFRATNDFLNDRLKSRNIHSEIVFALSPNNNIGEAFRRFGVGDATTNLLVLKVSTSPEVTLESVEKHLAGAIQGTEVAFEDCSFEKISDLDKIKRAYKFGAGTAAKGGKTQKCIKNGDSDPAAIRNERDQLEVSVLGAMALRGAT